MTEQLVRDTKTVQLMEWDGPGYYGSYSSRGIIWTTKVGDNPDLRATYERQARHQGIGSICWVDAPPNDYS